MLLKERKSRQVACKNLEIAAKRELKQAKATMEAKH